MSPVEVAKEIYEKYNVILKHDKDNVLLYNRFALDCALLSVEEMLINSKEFYISKHFWEEVKEEIIHLKNKNHCWYVLFGFYHKRDATTLAEGDS